MSNIHKARIITPEDFFRPGVGDGNVITEKWLFLAQGDSWFSIGHIPPWQTSNLLFEMRFPYSACIVNCARPGRLLTHMIDWRTDPVFLSMIAGRTATTWSAILLSGGGNDLIDAANTLPTHADGSPVPRHRRLLLTPQERAENGDISRYISEEGWTTFEEHLGSQFAAFMSVRDGLKSRNKETPVLFHLYDYPTARNAPAGTFPKPMGPWLYPALKAYLVPNADWDQLTRHLIDRLSALLAAVARRYRGVHVVDTKNTLIPAAPSSTGEDMDWVNEIHPTEGGYAKLAPKYVNAILGAVAHDVSLPTEANVKLTLAHARSNGVSTLRH